MGSASRVMESHVLAADLLRAQTDAVAIGLTGRRELLPVQAIVYGLYGPKNGADRRVRQARAWPAFRRVVRLFDTERRQLLTTVVLLNRSIAAWCAGRREADFRDPARN
jgi:hypothetical protein